MANAWGELAFGEGNFGEQNNATVPVTGIGGNPIAWNSGAFGSASFGGTANAIPLNLSEESVTVEVNEGFGRLSWGQENWGETGNSVLISGSALSTSLGVQENWGASGWNSPDTEWGGPYIPSVAIGQQVDLSGQQLNIQNLGTPLVFSATEVFLDQNPLQGLTIAEGTIDPAPDAILTGQQLNVGVGTVTAFNEQGWGRDDWGTEAWGAQGIWAFVDVTGDSLGVASGIQETWGQDEWGASTTEWGGNSVTDVDILSIAAVTGNELTAAEGTVDPSPDATVVGIGLSASVAVGSVVEADANVTTTGNALEIAQGQAELDAVTIASITGQQLNTTLNSIVAGASAEVDLTGVQANIALGNLNIQSWQIVDTGTTVSYTEVSTGTSVIWNDIDTAA
jgi:hypothetical protein